VDSARDRADLSGLVVVLVYVLTIPSYRGLEEKESVVTRPDEGPRPARHEIQALDLTAAGVEKSHPPEEVGSLLLRGPTQSEEVADVFEPEEILSGTPRPGFLLYPGEKLRAALGFLSGPVDQGDRLRG
jgi:hypothetical protein